MYQVPNKINLQPQIGCGQVGLTLRFSLNLTAQMLRKMLFNNDETKVLNPEDLVINLNSYYITCELL